jgi:signal transduction histidine kinase
MATIVSGALPARTATGLRGLAERVGSILAVSLGYYVLAYIGTILHVPPSSNAIVWLATAFLAGVFFLTPARVWWTFLLGLVPVHLYLVEHINARQPSLVVALTQIAGNVALAAAMVLVMRRVAKSPTPRFDTFQAMLTYILIGGVAVTASVSALIVSVHQMTGWSEDFWLSWRQWMLASVFPALTLTPLVVLTGESHVGIGAIARSRGEALAVSALLFIVAYMAFSQVGGTYGSDLRLAPLPFLLWAAARCGVWGVCLSLLAAASAIILQALGDAGPFARGATTVDVVSLQVYLVAISIPFLLLASLMEERRRAEEELRRSEARMEITAASTDTGLWRWDVAARELWMTEHCRAMFGLASSGAQTPYAFADAVHADDRSRVIAALSGVLAGKDARALMEFRVLGAEGDLRWHILQLHAERDASGDVARVGGVFRNVTERVLAQREAEQLGKRLLTLQDDERKSIAQALHDSTIQHLVAATLTLGMVERRSTLTEEARLLVQDIRDALDAATRELRTFTYLLRPPELERHGLRAVLSRYIEGFGARTGLLTAAQIGAVADELTKDQQRELLRIVQEGLANVHRHAAATRVTIRLRPYGHDLHLIIRDDGHGFQAPTPGANGEPVLGVGLPGMAARVKQFGGRFAVRSGGRGTKIHVAMPLRERQRRRRVGGAPSSAQELKPSVGADRR